jgi:hypothetical protein
MGAASRSRTPRTVPSFGIEDVKGICGVCRMPVFADQARSKNQWGAYAHAQCVAGETVGGPFPVDMPSGADPTLSAALHAALSRAEAAEEVLRTLKAQMEENDDALQQHFTEWQKLDGFLQSYIYIYIYIYPSQIKKVFIIYV